MRRRVRVLVFNVKGEDLLHLDRPNSPLRRPSRPGATSTAAGPPSAWPTPGRSRRSASGRPRGPTATANAASRPGGRARLRLDPVRIRRRGAPALLLHRGGRHAQPALLPRGTRARRAAAAGGAGERPPREPGPARRRGGGRSRAAPGPPAERADGRTVRRPRRAGRLARRPPLRRALDGRRRARLGRQHRTGARSRPSSAACRGRSGGCAASSAPTLRPSRAARPRPASRRSRSCT